MLDMFVRHMADTGCVGQYLVIRFLRFLDRGIELRLPQLDCSVRAKMFFNQKFSDFEETDLLCPVDQYLTFGYATVKCACTSTQSLSRAVRLLPIPDPVVFVPQQRFHSAVMEREVVGRQCADAVCKELHLRPQHCLRITLRFYTCQKEVNPSTAFCPSVFIPLVTTHDLPYAVLDTPVMLTNADFRANYFKYFYMLGTALATCTVTALCGITYDQLYEHPISAFLPTPNRPTFGKNRRLRENIVNVVRSAEVRSSEVRSSEVRFVEVRSAEVRSAEVRSSEVRSSEVR